MLIYVGHCFGGKAENIEKAKKITHDLQVKDPANCYVCPLLTFSNLEYGEIGYDEEMELCLDLLTVCDKLIVASEVSQGVRREIALAKRINMEVLTIDEGGTLRPFTE